MSDTGNPTIVARGTSCIPDLVAAAERLIDAVVTDERDSGGLLSRQTLHKAHTPQILTARWHSVRRRQ